jgi:hypothetical protein
MQAARAARFWPRHRAPVRSLLLRSSTALSAEPKDSARVIADQRRLASLREGVGYCVYDARRLGQCPAGAVLGDDQRGEVAVLGGVAVAPQGIECFDVVGGDQLAQHGLGVLDDRAVGAGLIGDAVTGCPHVSGYGLSGGVVAGGDGEGRVGSGDRGGRAQMGTRLVDHLAGGRHARPEPLEASCCNRLGDPVVRSWPTPALSHADRRSGPFRTRGVNEAPPGTDSPTPTTRPPSRPPG